MNEESARRRPECTLFSVALTVGLVASGIVFVVLFLAWAVGGQTLEYVKALLPLATAAVIAVGLYIHNRRTEAMFLTADNQAEAAKAQAEAATAQSRAAELQARAVKIQAAAALNQAEQYMTDRFVRAVEHLGSDKPAVRMGGVYSLEGLNRASPDHHVMIVETLSAFLRQRAKEHFGEPLLPPEEVPPPDEELQIPVWPETATDIEAALTVLGRLERPSGVHVPVDLHGVVLRDVPIAPASLRGANLMGADLCGVGLIDADLSGAFLVGTKLNSASLQRANLHRAFVVDVDLRNATCEASQFAEAIIDPRTIGPDGRPLSEWLAEHGVSAHREMPAPVTIGELDDIVASVESVREAKPNDAKNT